MYYEGRYQHAITFGSEWATHYVDAINNSTAWSGVETWATRAVFFTFATSQDVMRMQALRRSVCL